jgi:spore coat protein U-like protein
MLEMKRLAIIFSVVMTSAIAPAAIAQSCAWSAAPPTVAFGTYQTFNGGGNTSSTSGTVTCTGNATFAVTLSKGGSGTYSPRKMSAFASYNIYVFPTLTTIYGDNTGGTFAYTGSNTNGTNNYSGSVYGSAPAAQDLAPGLYSDSLIATLTYQVNGTGAVLAGGARTVPVSMTVISECRVDTFNMTFGAYNPFTVTALAQTAQVKVYCTKNTTATLSLDNGVNASGAQRRMISGGTYLNYTAALATTSATSTSSLVPLGPLGVGGITLNGTVPASQDVKVGSYIDTLQVLVNY